MSTSESPSTSGWKAGAKALAAFQAQNTGVAKGGIVSGGPRQGTKYANLTDILKVCAKGAAHGLSHSGQARLFNETTLIWREVLHHDSGESIYTEHPIAIPDKGLSSQRQQDLGGAITYARKYCCQALFGLYADDGLDPDNTSYSDAVEQQQPPVKTASNAVTKPASNGTTAPSSDDPQRKITEDEKALCREIVKDPEHGEQWKADFLKRFYPNGDGSLKVSQFKTKEHVDFLTALRSGLPY